MLQPILKIQHLRKLFPVKANRLLSGAGQFVHAVDDVSFTLQKAEILAVVGESGCGKSTLALTLIGLEKPTAGSIQFKEQEIADLNHHEWKSIRRQMQMIFQDPYESLNPLMSVGELVAEPLQVHGIAATRAERQQRVITALEDAGLKPAESFINRHPHELSGGQRQRVAIAAALVLEPTILLADEPVSMLDVSIRAEILNLLGDLRNKRGISILFITHDLSTVATFADRIAVMYLGRIVEMGAVKDVLVNPQHPYTRALLSVVPVPNPRLRRERVILQGETPNPINLPEGCRFHPRCPLAQEICKGTEPPLEVAGDEHWVACVLKTI